MNPSQSQRLPSFRDYSEVQKVVLPFSKNKILNKKTYVPNLDVSRKGPAPRVKDEGTSANISDRKDGLAQRRNERKHTILQTDGIFSSGIEKGNSSSHGKFTGKSTSATGNASVKNKQLKRVVEKLNGQRKSNTEPISFKEALDKRPEQFEKHSSISAYDLPSALPWNRVRKSESVSGIKKEDTKINSLLTDVLKPNDEDAPLFILKTPKYVPAILDDSQNPKMHIKRNDADADGYKCTIHDLHEGQIGKLQIMKSGKLRLVLGECKFTLQRGVKVNFKEELAVVKVDASKKVGEIVNLGDITDRIIVVPENVTELIKAA